MTERSKQYPNKDFVRGVIDATCTLYDYNDCKAMSFEIVELIPEASRCTYSPDPIRASIEFAHKMLIE